MLIVCPSCATSYDVEPASLQPTGRQVRCARCRTVWRAEMSRAEKLMAAAAALAGEAGPAEPAVAWAAAQQNATAYAALESGDAAWINEPAEPRIAAEASVEAADPQASWNEDGRHGDPVEVEGPPIVPAGLDEGRLPPQIAADAAMGYATAPAEDIESIAARRAGRGGQRRKQAWSITRLQMVILAFLVADAILVGWRKDIVRLLPQTASFYALIGLPVNIRGLAFTDIVTNIEEHEGVPILVVEGDIVNQSSTPADLPRLKLAVRNGAKQEIYSWTAAPPRATLGAYQAISFRTRLASPPGESGDVLVRFLNRRDIVAETR